LANKIKIITSVPGHANLQVYSDEARQVGDVAALGCQALPEQDVVFEIPMAGLAVRKPFLQSPKGNFV
jgi:hypothetical protein